MPVIRQRQPKSLLGRLTETDDRYGDSRERGRAKRGRAWQGEGFNTRHGRTLKTAYTKQFVSQAEWTGTSGSFEGHTDAQTKDRITNRGLVIFKETRN